MSTDLAKRRQAIKAFIDRNFGSQRAFCVATGLKPARVSKALQDRYISNRRLLPLEHAISEWREEQGSAPGTNDITVPVYALEDRALHPRGAREPVGPRTLPTDADRDRLVYVEVTFTHHTVIEMIDPEGVPLDALDGSAQNARVEYAGLAHGQWTYITLVFDEFGHPSIAGGAPSDALFFGRAFMTLRPRSIV